MRPLVALALDDFAGHVLARPSTSPIANRLGWDHATWKPPGSTMPNMHKKHQDCDDTPLSVSFASALSFGSDDSCRVRPRLHEHFRARPRQSLSAISPSSRSLLRPPPDTNKHNYFIGAQDIGRRQGVSSFSQPHFSSCSRLAGDWPSLGTSQQEHWMLEDAPVLRAA